ncbi:hypothetical protein ElyMa_000501200 [Elysia marginata]|uniref:Uncharacterized protein n=1 Tax=Elysia marginata TaxID=1093978 RepID=A0AAV4FWP1_9GAST|nr:hypothetical protein ElyMa_000501200 [Elysia marginata]
MVSQQPAQDLLIDHMSMKEIIKAIHQTNLGKTLGKDGIPTELYMTPGPNALEAFYGALLSIWKEEMSEEFRDALIVSLYKDKGGKSV